MVKSRSDSLERRKGLAISFKDSNDLTTLFTDSARVLKIYDMTIDNHQYYGEIYRILERCLEDLMSQEEEEKCLSMTPMVLESRVSRSSLALAMHWPALTSRRLVTCHMVTVTSTASNETP